MIRILIVYRRFSPHQLACLDRAVARAAATGDEVLPVAVHGPRPPGRSWPVLFPDRRRAPVALQLGRLLPILRRRRATVVLVPGWSDPLSWTLLALRRLLGLALAVVSDSTRADHPRSRSIESIKGWFVRRVGAAFAAGTRSRRYLEHLGLASDRIADGCDAIDAGPVRPGRLPSEPIVVGTAARLVEVKNLADAIRAVGRAASKPGSPPLRWRIAGGGPLARELRGLAAACRAPVEFLGPLPHQSMSDFYSSLDLYWQPSRSETWGIAIAEAMAAGRPVLVSDRCGSSEDLVDATTGWRHPVDSVDDLSTALEAALARRDDWPAIGRAARHRIEAWGPERFATGLLTAARRALR